MHVVYLGQISQWHFHSQTDEIQSGEVGNKDIKKRAGLPGCFEQVRAGDLQRSLPTSVIVISRSIIL